MNLITKWLLENLMEMFGDCFLLVSAVSEQGFENDVIVALLSVFKLIGLPFLGVALISYILKAMLDVLDSQQINLTDFVRRAILATIVYMFGSNFIKYLYLMIFSFANDLISALSGVDEFEWSVWEMFRGVNTLLLLILIAIACFYLVKTCINLMERFFYLIVMICMLYINIPAYIMGDDEVLIIWFKSCVGIALTQLFQTLLIVLGLSMFLSGGDMISFGLAIGAIVASSKVEKLLDRWGIQAGGGVSGAAKGSMSLAYQVKLLRGR